MKTDKSKFRILAIETSCDETAASVVEVSEKQVNILSNVIASQIDIHKQFGGVFPEKASRAHTEKIISVVDQAACLKVACADDIDLIAVTVGPGLIGSLLVGVNFAKTYAFVKNKPIIGINHWLGHMYSNWAKEPFPQFPALFLIVSGGHTGVVLMKSHTEIISLGQTLDDAAGEAFDKVAKLLELDYPGGPAISAEAEKFKIQNSEFRIKLPRPMIDSKDYNFSFSGLKTAVLNEVRKLQSQSITLNHYQSPMAHEFQQAVIDVLISKTIKAAYEFKPKSICICGGVSANKELRSQMQEAVSKLPWKASYHIPPFILSTDNAAMIGLAAAYQDKSKWTTFDKINADSSLKL